MAWAYLVTNFPLSILSFFSCCLQERQATRKKRMPLQSGLVSTLFLVLVSFSSFSQSSVNEFLKPSDSLNKSRRNLVYISESTVLGSSLLALNQLWYKDYEKSKFHFINDNNNWLQMDKMGHFYSSYHLSNFSGCLMQWSGASKNEQLIFSSIASLGYLSAIEVMDGYSSEWGASSGDVLANVSGTALYVSQELLWNEQRIVPKFSFHQTNFPSLRPETLGKSFSEQLFKDYNGQNYWLSFNIHSFTKFDFVPKWLNLAFGYGATGMVYATNEDALENYVIQKPYRQYYISLDVDLTKIKTKSHFLKTIFSVFNTLKIPSPTLEFGPKTSLRAYGFYF